MTLEGTSILAGAAEIGVAPNSFSTSRAHDDNKVRSAPASERDHAGIDSRIMPVPKRSDTAPGALDLGNAGAVNIYRTPSCGEASSYYDTRTNYPSLVLPVEPLVLDELSRREEQGWSPLEGDREIPVPTLPSRNIIKDKAAAPGVSVFNKGLGIWDAGDATGARVANATPGQSESTSNRNIIFDSPSEEEFHSPDGGSEDVEPETDIQGQHNHLDDSIFTPQSPTPVVEKAHTATILRATTSNKDLKPTGSEPALPVKNFSKPVFVNERSLSSSPEQGQEKTLEFDDQEDAERGPMPFSKESNDAGPHRPLWSRALLWVLLGLFVFASGIAVFIVLLLYPFHPTNMPVEAQWLNLTGFPPLPTGVLTVVGPQSVKDVNGCVSPSAPWSCDAPPGQGLSTTAPNQPNFRFLIRFRNGTIHNETLLQPTNFTLASRASSPAAQAGQLVRRSIWSNQLYASSPQVPSTDDQVFLGHTTDNNSFPYNGEQTPFYISLLNPVTLPVLEKRSTIGKREWHYPYPKPSDYNPTKTTSSPSSASGSSQPSSSSSASLNVPNPRTRGDNEPTPPELYPFAYAQPLRLFNRGQSTEHYGFYTYFDRTIYLSTPPNNDNTNTSATNFTTTTATTITSNTPLDSSKAVCTWSQTRFLVQIWTRQSDITTLTSTSNASSIPAAQSTANDMTGPGSFPNPVTITLDRHGGTADKKGVYCYALDAEKRVVPSTGTWVAEDRAFGGTIVDPAVVPTNGNLGMAEKDQGGSGVDGGSGGCACQWRN